ncbi:hypothetical protein BHE90_004439 [Fusarium euwallaceae]|uniref:Uncharacterized protein n=1 Tax=Fusarium euwallaceae TaxID=1147111 RepID=A0A430LZ44_9HYPO|nr:hypothetical protein BHE90_004439 [Fusarium euwallaceae]
MDECVRLEEALQTEESQNAQEQSPRRRSGRRSFKWPFSLDDYGRTDEYRLPPVSTGLAAFSPGPAEASPRKRGTNPSPPRISHRSDNRNDLLRRATRSPQRRDDPTVERVSSRTEPKPRVERRASYIAPSISQHRDNLSQATPQSSAPLRSVTYTDLQRLRDNEDPRRHQSLPRTFQPRTYIEEDQDRDRLTDVKNAVASSERL